MTPTTIYILSHIYKTRDGEYEEKLLGSYSSRATAQQAIKRYKRLPGFRQHPESFVIFEAVLDQDAAWIEGFFTLNPHAALIFKIVPRAEWEAESGDYHGPIDGKMGTATAAALRRYQSEHDLPLTGLADDPTRERLGL